jgi:hypothetical protein
VLECARKNIAYVLSIKSCGARQVVCSVSFRPAFDPCSFPLSEARRATDDLAAGSCIPSCGGPCRSSRSSAEMVRAVDRSSGSPACYRKPYRLYVVWQLSGEQGTLHSIPFLGGLDAMNNVATEIHHIARKPRARMAWVVHRTPGFIAVIFGPCIGRSCICAVRRYPAYGEPGCKREHGDGQDQCTQGGGEAHGAAAQVC